MSGLLALDWGTSSLRGALMDGEGRVVEERSFARGILSVSPGGFPAVFEELFGDWAAQVPLCLVSGMAGSKQGWVEAPYCACPAGFGDVAEALRWIASGTTRLAIVPGLSCENGGVPDVMRGEEVQVFGALQLLDLQDATLVLPGTHSKWVRAVNGRIEGFRSFMTGEFYALLRQHSILSRTLPEEDGALDEAAFSQGVAHALSSTSLLQTAFSVRTLSLFDRMPAAAMPSYLSGLVIGEELRAQPPDSAQEVVVMGSGVLTRRYELALAQRGVQVRTAGSEATWQGLWALARTLAS
ncbi:MAG: 2-dehydro-3-deoxygalactonokinase [Pseudomonadota bacterium]